MYIFYSELNSSSEWSNVVDIPLNVSGMDSSSSDPVTAVVEGLSLSCLVLLFFGWCLLHFPEWMELIFCKHVIPIRFPLVNLWLQNFTFSSVVTTTCSVSGGGAFNKCCKSSSSMWYRSEMRRSNKCMRSRSNWLMASSSDSIFNIDTDIGHLLSISTLTRLDNKWVM